MGMERAEKEAQAVKAALLKKKRAKQKWFSVSKVFWLIFCGWWLAIVYFACLCTYLINSFGIAAFWIKGQWQKMILILGTEWEDLEKFYDIKVGGSVLWLSPWPCAAIGLVMFLISIVCAVIMAVTIVGLPHAKFALKLSTKLLLVHDDAW